jgi:hypothetical protein
VDFGNVIWLPEPEMVINSCPLSLGQNVGSEQTLFTVPSQVVGAKVSEFPENMIAGDRVLLVSDEEFQLDKDGNIAQKDLLRLSATSAYRVQIMSMGAGSSTGSVALNAEYQLAQPVNISVVPPSAIITETETKTCVIVDEKPVAVNIVGSELGRTFVEFTGTSPENVAYRPAKGTACE